MSQWLKIRPIMSVKHCLPVPVFHFWSKLMHPAARSLCNSCVTCLIITSSALENRRMLVSEVAALVWPATCTLKERHLGMSPCLMPTRSVDKQWPGITCTVTVHLRSVPTPMAAQASHSQQMPAALQRWHWPSFGVRRRLTVYISL